MTGKQARKAAVARSEAMPELLGRAAIPTAVDAVIEEVLGPRAALLGKRSRNHPSRKSSSADERQRAAETRTRHSNSLNQIAQMLHCEGFDEFAALGVLHYAKNRLWGPEWGNKVAERKKALGTQCFSLTADQRKVVGQFIHEQAAAAFQSGLRIGLMASLWTLALVQDRDK